MLRYLLILPILLYWKLIPAAKRNRCIFKESCSLAVYKTLLVHGSFLGIKMFLFRFQNCKPGYTIFFQDQQFMLKTIQAQIISERDIATDVIQNVRDGLQHSITYTLHDKI